MFQRKTATARAREPVTLPAPVDCMRRSHETPAFLRGICTGAPIAKSDGMSTPSLNRLLVAALTLASSGLVTTGCVVHEHPAPAGPTRAEIRHEDREDRREDKREDKEEKREERHDDDYR